jgi:hypothetical protein
MKDIDFFFSILIRYVCCFSTSVYRLCIVLWDFKFWSINVSEQNFEICFSEATHKWHRQENEQDMFGQNTKTYNKLSNEKHHKKTYHMGYFLKYLSHHRQIIFTQLIWNYAILPWNNISLLHKLETLFLDNTCHVPLSQNSP